MAFIEKSTGFKANHISASSMHGIVSLSGSLASSASFGSIEVAGFSGQTNLLDFSASIATVSGSVSTRLSSLESGTTTKTLVSSSAQIAAEISGAFGADSASFDTRVKANETNVSTNAGNISTNSTAITALQGRNVNTVAGSGLTGGGNLSADRSLSVNFADTTLQTNVSGAFAAASGGLAGRLKTLEGADIANAQALGKADSPVFAGLTVQGDITAENLVVSSSVVHFTQSFSSGSTGFGDTLDDKHSFTGSMVLSGSAGSPLLDISYDGSSVYAPINLNGNNTKIPNLNADLLDGKSLEELPAFLADSSTGFANNALSGDMIEGGTIGSTTITKLAIGDLSIPSDNNELHVRKIDKLETISGSAGASASIDYIESSATGVLAGNLVHSINVTYAGGKFSFNGDSAPNFQIVPGYTYRFVQDDGTNASHLIGFKNAGVDYTTDVKNVGTPGTATAGKAQTSYTELKVDKDTPGVLTYYDKTAGSDAAGASLIKEGTGGGATLISGSHDSSFSAGTGGLKVAEHVAAQKVEVGTLSSGKYYAITGSSLSTGSFGRIEQHSLATASLTHLSLPGLPNVSKSIADLEAVSGVSSVTSPDGSITVAGSGVAPELSVNFSDAENQAIISGSFRGELSSSLVKVVGGGVSGSRTSTFSVGEGGVQIANHMGDSQKTHLGVVNSGKYYAISGSAVSTGSFGKLETVAGATLENGISGSLVSTGSLGHIEFFQKISGSLHSTASFDKVLVRGFSANEIDRVSTNHGAGLLAFSASVAQRLADEADDIEGQFLPVSGETNVISTAKDTRVTGSMVVSASNATSSSLTVKGQGGNVFNVEGSAGRLFTIADTMSGSLFSVADFSGLAALEVFDNDKITLGMNAAPIVVETNSANSSAMMSGSLQSTASFGQVIAGDKAILKDVDLSGNLIPTADVSTDLGSATKRFANLFVGDLLLSNKTRINPDTEKVGNSIDGTWGDYQLQEGKDDLFIENKRTGKTFRFVLQEINPEEL